jgi:hypothetical protein
VPAPQRGPIWGSRARAFPNSYQRPGGPCAARFFSNTRLALREYIARRRQAKVTSLFGTVDYDPKYDYKKQRRRR